MIRTINFLLVLLCFAGGSFAQFNAEVEAELKTNSELYFTFQLDELKMLNDISKNLSIDKVEGNSITANANAQEFQQFLNLGLGYEVLPHPNEKFNPTMFSFEQIQTADAWDFYPTYDAYVAMMYQFETSYPSICDVFSIGQSVDGRELLVAKISDNIQIDEAEPEFLYTATIHGDETTGYILMLRLIDSLLTNYGSNPRITNMVNNIELHINPLSNPDGTYAAGNSTVSGATRRNSNNVDLNRNYPDPDDGPHPDGNAWQAETVAFMAYAEDHDFTMSINFHGGSEVCNYPWDTWSFLSADDAWWQFVCHEYADTAQQYSPSSYMSGFDDGITNGYAWYTITGGRQDYMNYFHQCREFTAEISNTKLPSASSLPAYWEYNRRSLLNYIEQSLYGLTGTVTDAVSGQPIEAEVYVLNHEADSSWVYSSLPFGNYYRYLNAGSYDIRYSAPCYQDHIEYGVNIINYSATVKSIQLQPVTNAADFTASTQSATTGEAINLYDASCGNPTAWTWSFAGPGNVNFHSGTSPSSQDPVVSFDSPGSYDVSLVVTTTSGSYSVTKSAFFNISNCVYCDAYATNPTDEWIGNVTFTDIDNTSSGENGYEDYTYISTDVEAGLTYPVSVFIDSDGSWTENVFVFIDWDQNCVFDETETTDLGETYGPGTLNGNISVPSDAATGATRMRVMVRYSQNPGSCDTYTWGEVEDYTVVVANPVLTLDLNVFLEGAFSGSTMHTMLNAAGGIPISQPFNTSPWNYNGAETVLSIPANVVDWILIELRDAPNAVSALPGTMIDRQAAFLLNDGSIVNVNTMAGLQSAPAIPISNDLFVVIYHRNHLPVLSANSLTNLGGIYNYNFTSPGAQAYGTNAQADLGGVFGMIAGDADANGDVEQLDLDGSWDNESGAAGYLNADLNLDGQSNNKDKNELWVPNQGQSDQLPE